MGSTYQLNNAHSQHAFRVIAHTMGRRTTFAWLSKLLLSVRCIFSRFIRLILQTRFRGVQDWWALAMNHHEAVVQLSSLSTGQFSRKGANQSRRASSEQRAPLASKLLDLFLQFLFSRLKIRGHARQTHHPFDLPVNDLPVEPDFILGEILPTAVGAIGLFPAAHCSASRNV